MTIKYDYEEIIPEHIDFLYRTYLATNNQTLRSLLNLGQVRKYWEQNRGSLKVRYTLMHNQMTNNLPVVVIYKPGDVDGEEEPEGESLLKRLLQKLYRVFKTNDHVVIDKELSLLIEEIKRLDEEEKNEKKTTAEKYL